MGWSYPLYAGLGLFVLMSLMWIWQKKSRNAAIVDVAWSASLGFVAMGYAFWSEGAEWRRWLLGTVVSLWAFRLAWHLYKDRIQGQVEEGRYQQMRKEWGEHFQKKIYYFYQAQAGLNVILSLPFLFIASNPNPNVGWIEVVALVIFIIAIIGESIADKQLKKFKSNPANKGLVCQSGLWKYSRHPNYFFEWSIWLSFGLLSVAAGGIGILGLIAPILMLHFIINVTGIPLTEAQALRSRGEAYQKYQKSTSAFVPWFTKEAV